MLFPPEQKSYVIPLMTLMLVMYVYTYFPTYMGIDDDEEDATR